jgi:hypothetical protein
MKIYKQKPIIFVVFIVLAVIGIFYQSYSIKNQKIEKNKLSGITIEYPFDNAVFPPDIVSPTFRWLESKSNVDLWKITISFENKKDVLNFTSPNTKWRPLKENWEKIKYLSRERKALFEVYGTTKKNPKKIYSYGKVSFKTSSDSVIAPIFYREVNLPFEEAVKDPTQIRWRLGSISSEEPPKIVLQKLPVCGNCHSFSKNGKVLGMEVDSGNDKGAYAIMKIIEDILLDRSKIISWASYKKEDKEPTFGLLCQVSPDGNFVAGTVKDQALAVYRPNLMFSQLFFLIKGIVAIYDVQNKKFFSLKGADDRNYVQTNATWSPNGQYLVFSRSKAYNLDIFNRQRRALIGGPEAEDFIANQGKSYKYDLVRIPFNNGKGGIAEPVKGAYNNGMSNYFAKYSPNGKWIVFCRANNYMLLQPDSRLYIIPAEGGEARELECNRAIMNSWHSWSPNSRWLVFSSKVFGPYTQLFLTHISDSGTSSIPVMLENFLSPNRAANIPEFLNNTYESLVRIREDYLDAYSYYRIANILHQCGDYNKAIPAYRVAIKYNPKDYFAHNNLGALLYEKGKKEEAAQEFLAAINLKIDDYEHYQAHTNYAIYLLDKGDFEEAIKHLTIAYTLHPDSITKTNIELAKNKIKKIKEQKTLEYQ